MARPHDPRAKAELLQAAAYEFRAVGLEKARIEDITRRAGRSKGSFYQHFSSKTQAFQQIVDECLALLADRLTLPPSLAALGPEQLDEALDLMLAHDVETFELVWANRERFCILLAGGFDSDFAHLGRELAERARSSSVIWLQWGKSIGLFRDELDVEFTSYLVSGAYDRLARRLVDAPKKPDLQLWVSQAMELFFVGLCEPDALRRARGERPLLRPAARKSGSLPCTPACEKSALLRAT